MCTIMVSDRKGKNYIKFNRHLESKFNMFQMQYSFPGNFFTFIYFQNMLLSNQSWNLYEIKCTSSTQKSLNSNSTSVTPSVLQEMTLSFSVSLLCNNGLGFRGTLTTEFNVIREPTGSKA